VPFSPALLSPCTARQWLARMLNNLKRTYVQLRSFPQARIVADLLHTVEPRFGTDLRDRGLLAYHLDDYPSALRDLERYLRLKSWMSEEREEHERVTEHRRIASVHRLVTALDVDTHRERPEQRR
jgi:regulator of sirC expression with transglutaminase-like and TPR domain